MPDTKPIVTRIPPSPTGHLHIGTARTALFNYLFARQHGGSFVFRSEDTDKERSTEAFEKEIIEGLAWLGITTDSIYRQSERSAVYKKYLEDIVASGNAYVSREESKHTPGTEVEVVRLKNPNKEVVFEDLVRGEIRFDTTELGDFVIARSLDDALYHFAVVVDDAEMEVTHVIRGEDHISNTPRQILIQEALGFTRPIYAHLPLILAPDRSKLSKRHGAVSLSEYQEEGFLPEAIINYLALLGWNPGTEQEIFTLEELVVQFDISQVQKGGAVFNREKLLWVNKEHLKRLDGEAFLAYVLPHIEKTYPKAKDEHGEMLSRLLPILRERIEVGSQLQTDMENGEYDFAFARPTVNPALIQWKNDETPADALPRLKHAITLLEALSEHAEVEEIKAALWDYAEEVGKGELLWPLRVALTGKKQSPDPFSVIYTIGVQEAILRVKNACDTISA